MKRKEYLNKTKELKELKLRIIEFENNPMYTTPFDLQIPMFYKTVARHYLKKLI